MGRELLQDVSGIDVTNLVIAMHPLSLLYVYRGRLYVRTVESVVGLGNGKQQQRRRLEAMVTGLKKSKGRGAVG